MKFKYAYDAASNETDRYTYLSGVTIEQIYARDSLNRMASRVLKKNNQTISGSTEGYTYNRMNRLTEVDRDDAADSFSYYWSGELWTAQYGGGAHMTWSARSFRRASPTISRRIRQKQSLYRRRMITAVCLEAAASSRICQAVR